MSTIRYLCILVPFLLGVFPSLTQAGPILSGVLTPSSVPHTATVAPTTLIVDNDPLPPPAISPNTVTIVKGFIAAPPPPPFLDVFFSVAITGGITEYLVTEIVTNSTGVPWDSYHMILGFGEGAGFTKSIPGDTLDFDVPDGPFPPFFSDVFGTATLLDEDEILWSSGIVPAGGTLTFVFPLDAFDGGFTLREFPVASVSVPEPGTCLLLITGLLGLLGFRFLPTKPDRKGSSEASLTVPA